MKSPVDFKVRKSMRMKVKNQSSKQGGCFRDRPFTDQPRLKTTNWQTRCFNYCNWDCLHCFSVFGENNLLTYTTLISLYFTILLSVWDHRFYQLRLHLSFSLLSLFFLVYLTLSSLPQSIVMSLFSLFLSLSLLVPLLSVCLILFPYSLPLSPPSFFVMHCSLFCFSHDTTPLPLKTHDSSSLIALWDHHHHSKASKARPKWHACLDRKDAPIVTIYGNSTTSI